MRAIELGFFNALSLACMVVMSVLFMCALLRAVRGPRVTDRLVAVNMIGTMTIVIIAILSVYRKEDYLADVCLIYAMVSFLAVVVLTKVYTGVYNLSLESLEAPHPQILDVNSYKEWLDRGEVLFFGNGSEKARTVITHPNARFVPDVVPLAVDMLALSDKAFRENNFLSLAYSVPTYLKEFQATRPKPLF